MGNFLAGAKKNWKSTSFGVIGGLATLVVTAPQLFGGSDAAIVQISRVLLSAGVIGVGAVAKDYDKTGT